MRDGKMTFDLEITKYVPPGDGFGLYQGKAVFVPGTAVGDVVRVRAVKEKKRFIAAVLEEVLSPSDERIEAPCPHAARCGGCSLMHLAYDDQIELKKKMLREVFGNHGLEISTEIVPSPQVYGFRYRAQLNYANGRLGFSPRKGGGIVEIPQCRILSPGIMGAVRTASQLNVADGECVLLESSANGGVAGSLLIGEETLALPRFPSQVEEDYGFGSVTLNAEGFAQSNPHITREISGALVEQCGDVKRVCELYCGCGTFSIPVASCVDELQGYDIGQGAVATARENARRNRLTNVRFKVGNLDRIGKLPNADTIMVDPPRKGLGRNAIQRIGRSKASRLFYISCNPSTLARDLEILRSRDGFHVSKVTGYDMYCHSTHLEVLAVLAR
ncbi:MAG: class I SAM-dependent RNA methyltransferase [Proteobacteria bacterium]|nr:class I SAM-dependent RNA methyltransferase [Pseudomonadota bacterium]